MVFAVAGVIIMVLVAGIALSVSNRGGDEKNGTPLILSSGSVDPQRGDSQTSYTFSVRYTDPEDREPTTHSVYVDDYPYDMSQGPGWISFGAVFQHTVNLGSGNHHYYFSFSGSNSSVRLPVDGVFSGPVVTEYVPPPPPPSNTAHYSTIWLYNDMFATIDVVGVSFDGEGAFVAGPIAPYGESHKVFWDTYWSLPAKVTFYYRMVGEDVVHNHSVPSTFYFGYDLKLYFDYDEVTYTLTPVT
jgi:hypothetical protein